MLGNGDGTKTSSGPFQWGRWSTGLPAGPLTSHDRNRGRPVGTDGGGFAGGCVGVGASTKDGESSYVMPPFVYVHAIVLNTNVTSSSAGRPAVVGSSVSGTDSLTDVTWPCLIETV